MANYHVELGVDAFEFDIEAGSLPLALEKLSAAITEAIKIESIRTACPECEGSEEIACATCQGTGDDGECDECKGTGEMDCPDCSGNSCRECDGDGVVECDECGGTGGEPCGECDGGTVECPRCDDGTVLVDPPRPIVRLFTV